MNSTMSNGIDKLHSLRDDVKVRLHLASLDLKKEWDEKIEPTIFEAEQKAKSVGETSQRFIEDAVKSVEAFIGRLSDGKPSTRH